MIQHDDDFDVLIFTQHWPYTICYQWEERSTDNECSLPARKNSWTIHGIWPTKFHEIGPLFCNKTWHFNLKSLEPIEDRLKESWINIEKNTPLDGLWKHEWMKHGTCTAPKIIEMNTELKYFSKGLDWLEQYSISKLLDGSQVVPMGPDFEGYNLEDIHYALSQKLPKTFGIVCFKDQKSRKQFLFEIRICFNKDLTPADCDGIVMLGDENEKDKYITNCHLEEPILYPAAGTFPHPSMRRQYYSNHNSIQEMKPLLINLYKLINLIKWMTL
jgi:ribonuclease T2